MGQNLSCMCYFSGAQLLVSSASLVTHHALRRILLRLSLPPPAACAIMAAKGGGIMPKMKIVYIHFESKPALERLGRYFAQYPGYQKIFATSYTFSVPYKIPNADLRDWARECFPYD